MQFSILFFFVSLIPPLTFFPIPYIDEVPVADFAGLGADFLWDLKRRLWHVKYNLVWRGV